MFHKRAQKTIVEYRNEEAARSEVDRSRSPVERMLGNSDKELNVDEDFEHVLSMTPEEAKEICTNQDTLSARVFVTLKEAVALRFVARYFRQFGHIEAISCMQRRHFYFVQFESEEMAKACLDNSGEDGAIEIEGIDGFARPSKGKAQLAENNKRKRTSDEDAYDSKLKGSGVDFTDESTQSKRIYVDHSTSPLKVLEEYFGQFGPIAGILRSPKDRSRSHHPRAAIIQFEDVSSAELVLGNEKRTNVTIRGEKIMVRCWNPRDGKNIMKKVDDDENKLRRHKMFSDPETANRRIHVGNIQDDTISNTKLKNHFSVFGPVYNSVIYKKRNGFSYAFVLFKDEAGVSNCLASGPTANIEGQTLHVSAVKSSQKLPKGNAGGYPGTGGSFGGNSGTGGSYGGNLPTGGIYGGNPPTGVLPRMGNGGINSWVEQPTGLNCDSFNPPGMGISTPMSMSQSNPDTIEMFQDPQGMSEIAQVLDPRRNNDAEIIIMNESLRNYAEYIESILLSVKLKVDMIFTPPGMASSKIIGDLIKRNCLFALMITRESVVQETITVYVLQGDLQTHMNIPLLNAMRIVEENFFNHIQSTFPHLMMNQSSGQQDMYGGSSNSNMFDSQAGIYAGSNSSNSLFPTPNAGPILGSSGANVDKMYSLVMDSVKIAKDLKQLKDTRDLSDIMNSPEFHRRLSSLKAKADAVKQDTRPESVSGAGHWREFSGQGRGRWC